MRPGPLLAAGLLLCAAGCQTLDGGAGRRSGGTVRVFDGHRVAGYYVRHDAYEHYLRARLATDAGRPEEAAQELALAVSYDGASAFLRTCLGATLLDLDRLDEARDSLEAALRFDPDYAEAHLELGRLARRQGDAPLARAQLRQAIDLDPTCEEAYLALAELHREAGDPRDAEAVVRTLVARLPRSAVGQRQLARSAAARGDLPGAEAALRQAMELDAASVPTQVELARLLLAAGRPAEAERELRLALERSGRDPRVAEVLVQALVAAGRADEADALVDSLDSRGSGRDRRLQVGWILLGRGRAERALALATDLLGGGDLTGARLLRGAALAALRRTDEAVSELGRVAPESPDFVAAELRIGRALADGGRLREAIDLVGGALARVRAQPESDPLAGLLAELHERAGDRERARHLLDDALKLHPASSALAYSLGGLLERGGEPDRAVEVVAAILTRSPDNAEALNFIGWSLTDRGVRLQEARGYLERARLLRPTSGEIADSLGWLYLRTGRVDEAVRLLEQAGRLLPEAPDVLAHLGEAYLRREDRPRALASFRKALSKNPDARVRQAVEARLLHLEEGRVGAR